jgi:hypothetical protein
MGKSNRMQGNIFRFGKNAWLALSAFPTSPSRLAQIRNRFEREHLRPPPIIPGAIIRTHARISANTATVTSSARDSIYTHQPHTGQDAIPQEWETT